MTRPPYRLAIIADAHFHDPRGRFGGAGIDFAGERLVLRPWAETRAGIRAVNESAAALTAALAHIREEGIRHVILAGDYSDDGQVETVRRLAALLHHWQDRHGLRFHAIPGNHDVHGPHGKHVTHRIMAGRGDTALLTSDPSQGGILSSAMRCQGQPEGLVPMAGFGLFRQPDHLHWESPFGPDDAPGARMYQATAPDGSVTHRLMDASYLVEPEPGLWLMMLDANVWEPRPGRSDPARKKAFGDASEAGWNALLRVRPYLVEWIASVTARAKVAGKVLVTVSHYPVLDPFLSARGAEAALTPESSIARRTPGPQVAEALIAAGLTWHAGGHLHVHATNRVRTATGSLTDVALPSLVTHPPAFTVLTAGAEGIATGTFSLADLPHDPDLSALYAAGGRDGPPLPYGAFLAEQFRARVREVRMPRDWPADVLDWTEGRTARDLAWLPGLPEAAGDCRLADLAADLHLLREGGALALPQVPPDRLHLCRSLALAAASVAVPDDPVAAFWHRFLSILPPEVA